MKLGIGDQSTYLASGSWSLCNQFYEFNAMVSFDSLPQDALLPGARIAIAITHTTPGGLLELWQDLAAALRAKGHRVDLVAFYPSEDDLGQPQVQPGWTYVLPRRQRSPLAGLALLRGLWRHMRRTRPGVIVTAMPFAGIIASLMGRFAVPASVIVTHHSPSFTYAPALRRIERRTSAFGNVRAIVCVSQAVADSFCPAPRRYEARLRTIPNALPRDVERELAVLRDSRTGRSPGRRLVAIGRLVKQKNYPVLLRAMAHLDDVTLDVIGEGEDRADLMAMADALGIAGRVAFRGQLPRAEALRLAAQSDVFVQPSLYEGHSLALIEAACLGLPLIVSDVPTQVEGVTMRSGEICGQIVGHDDDRALAQAVRRLLDRSEDRARWSEAAVRLGQDSTMDEMVTRYEELVQSALAPFAGAN
jgi:glycosyltransferase involved in cell wall biosynthesis